MKIEEYTESRTRTDTVLPPPDFESGASTSSAIPAFREIIIDFGVKGKSFFENFKFLHVPY